MSALRTSLRSTLLRSFLTTPRTSLPIASQRFATQDYGSGTGDPVGDNPQQQGENPSADLEHPGPPPPKVGQGTGITGIRRRVEAYDGRLTLSSPPGGPTRVTSS